MQNDQIMWEAPEYIYREKSREWFISFWIIMAALFAVAVLFKNFLFAGIIVLTAFTVTLYARREPSLLRFEITRVGINTHRTFYPYSFLTAFWIDHLSVGSPKLLLVSSKLLMPMIVIPLGDQDPDEVRNFLNNYMVERELFEPLSHKLLDYFGF